MATTTGLLEQQQFPGAPYSGTGEAWERKAKEAIGLLPDRHGFSPSVVLGPKPPDTIMAEATLVPQEERQQYGRANCIGVMTGKTVTPRKLAKSLNTPLRTASTMPYQGWDEWDQEEEEEEEQDDANAGGNGANGGIEDTNLMPIEGMHEIHNPDAITDKIWKALKAGYLKPN